MAIPVNFPLLMHRLSERGWETVESSDRDLPQIETWLLCRGEGATATRRAFLKHFRRAHWEAADAALTDARAHKQAGRSQPALDAYRRALRLSPRDWRVLAEAGEFIALTAGDVPAALRLVERALDINPWTSPYLWTIKGDCLSRLQRWDEAHRAFTRAQQLDPSDLRAAIGLVNCGTQLGDDEAVLTQIAQALRADVTGSSRKALLAHQQRILAVLGARHRAARDHLQKRNTAFAAALLRCPSTGP